MEYNMPVLKLYYWLITYLRAYKWVVLSFMTCGLVISGIELMIPKFIEYVINVIMPNKDVSLFWQLFGLLSILLIIMVGVTALRNIFEKVFSEKASRDIQYALIKQLRLLGFSYYERHPVGETLNLFHTELPAVQQMYRLYLPETIQKLIFLTITSFLLVTTHLGLSLITIPCLLSYYLIGPYFERKTTLLAKEGNERRADYGKAVYDSLSAAIEVRAFSVQEWDVKRVVGKLGLLLDTWKSQFLYNYIRGSVRGLTVSMGALFVFLYGAYLLQGNQINIGEFVSFIFYYFFFMGNVTRFIALLIEQNVIMHQVHLVYSFMQQIPDVAESKNPTKLIHISGRIEFQNVNFSYNPERKVLNRLNLVIQSGERVALVGTSGNGKSTIIKMVGRFYDPTDGLILLDGIPLRDMALGQLRESIGYVFQETYLFGGTVRENILFGQPQATDDQVIEAAKAAYAHEFIIQLPQGYDTIVGERGIKLSGGQKQRIAITRMFIKNPPIIVLDEATSALDNVSEKEVQMGLDQLLQGRTTIAVAHRLSTIKDYDRILLIDEGKVLEEGTYDDLMERKGSFYRLAGEMIE